ncbi:jg7484 [Pararge aegeria aegeria]|uniref:Jg7484 protein n=1 Tax=Pararge aegeria aegeria TaxID=348720 RepID=A0A8S4R9N4_9NEOP|nr:jg7484 [Pararge aegeria aegeria]
MSICHPRTSGNNSHPTLAPLLIRGGLNISFTTLTIRLLLTMLPIMKHNQPLPSVFAGEGEVPDSGHPDVGSHHGLGGVRTNPNRGLSRGGSLLFFET